MLIKIACAADERRQADEHLARVNAVVPIRREA